MKLKHRLVLSSAFGLIFAVPVWADNPGGGSLDEVVVTATKRSENINKVGMSITALSGETLKERRVTSLEDLAAVVPGLSYSQSTTNTPIFTLRGIGFNESTLGVYPAVSVYLDQTPLPFPVLASHTAFDLERVEVLKGPQGTLFGENSTGGAINYIAAKPTDHYTAGGDVSYGHFNQTDGNAYVSGPLTDKLLFRIAGTGHHMDDWQRSITRSDTNGHQSYIAGRLLLDWRPTDTVKLLLNVNGWNDTSQPQALQLVAVRPQSAHSANAAIEAVQPFAPNNARAADWSSEVLDPSLGLENLATGFSPPSTWKPGEFRPFSDRKLYQVALRADVDLTSDLILTLLSSYDHFDQTQRTDGDGSALVTFDLQKNDGSIRSYNEEVRIANDSNATLRYMLGGNYENSEVFENQLLRFFQNSNSQPALLYTNGGGGVNTQKMENWSSFGSLEYSLTPQLTLKGSIRYTRSTDHANLCGYGIQGGNVDSLFNVLGHIYGTVPFTPVVGYGPSHPYYDCYSLNYNLVPGQPFLGSLTESNVSWRGGLDYQLDPSTLLYMSVSRGYKAGSFPSLNATSWIELLPVKQEAVTAFEGGFKAQMFDRKVTVSNAIFYSNYNNKQVRGENLDPTFGLVEQLINIPKSRILGDEAEITIRPIRGLSINGAVTYLDSEIQQNPPTARDYNAIGQLTNFVGASLPLTPRWSSALNVDYRWTMAHGTPFIGVSVDYRGPEDGVPGARRIAYVPSAAFSVAVLKPGVTNPFLIDGYVTADARIGYEVESGAWRVTAWAKNIFDKYYWTSVIPYGEGVARLAGMPRTFGLAFGFNF